MECLREAAAPKARAHPPVGTGSPAQAVVGALGGPQGGSIPQGPGTPAWGDGDSCPGGGRSPRRACEGQRSPRFGHTSMRGRGVLPRRCSVLFEGPWGGQQSPRPGHTSLGGTGSPAQVVVGVQGGPARGSNPQGMGTTASREDEFRPGGGWCSWRACGGQQPPRPGHTRLGGRGVLPRCW